MRMGRAEKAEVDAAGRALAAQEEAAQKKKAAGGAPTDAAPASVEHEH